MGTVYRAVQISLERAVALKLLSPALTDDREFVDRFVAEARAAAKFSHPNIIQVYNAGEAEGVFFLAMEFMPGGSVQQMIDREGALSAEKALRLTIDAARALIWAEDQNIVHRDIKPDNLLLGEAGIVKVADFGLAADRRTSKTLYVGGKVLGTPGFMAPEQALGKSTDHRADIYALGSTLYAALTGSPPFDGDTPLEVLLRKVKEDPKPLAEAAPDVPRVVVAVVEKLMARRPEDRYQHATEAHAGLEEALATCLDGGVGGSKGPGFASRLAGAFRRALGKPGKPGPGGTTRG
jgi:serine/threonine-protein kinase